MVSFSYLINTPSHSTLDDGAENEVKVTFRQKLEKFLTSAYGKWLNYVSLFLSFISCIIYVITAYMVDVYS